MRIDYVCRLFHPSVGGTEHCVRALSVWLCRRGHSVNVLTARAGHEKELHERSGEAARLPKHEFLDGVHIFRVKVAWRLRDLLLRFLTRWPLVWRIPEHFDDFWHLLQRGPIIPGIIWRIYRDRPDIILSTSAFGPTTWFCLLAKRLLGIPVIAMPCLHTNEQWATLPTLFNWLGECDRVLALTEYEKQYLVQHGLPETRVVTTGLGVDLAPALEEDLARVRSVYRLPPAGGGVLYMGRLVAYKGASAVLSAMEKLWAEGCRAPLVLAGSSSGGLAWLDERLGKLGAKRELVYLALDFPDSDKAALLACCDIMALPSKQESFGFAYVEAWSQRKPVLAAPESAASSYVEDGVNGFLVSPDDEVGMVRALASIFSDPEAARRMGEAGYRRWAERYRWDVVGEKIERVCAEAIEARRHE